MAEYQEQKELSQALHFSSNEEERFLEIRQCLIKLAFEGDESSNQVLLEISEEQLAVNATILSALSPYWRNLINTNAQDSPIIYKMSPVISHGSSVLFPLIKLLLYTGNVSLPVDHMQDILSILSDLHLETSNFGVTDSGKEVEDLTWFNHFDLLMNGLQTMCNNQQCTDLSIFVDGHVMKVHRFVICSYSEVISDLFRENDQIKTLHLPNISVKSAHILIGYMYCGKGIIPPENVEEFSKLCKFMKVIRLTNMLKLHEIENAVQEKNSEIEKAIQEENSEKPHNVFITMEPEISLVLKRLLMMFDVKGKTDLTLVVGNKRIFTHKSIIGMTSPTLHSLLMEENTNEQSAILISNADPVSVSAVIALLYNRSCMITRSQMDIAASFLDSGLFKLHMSDSTSSLEGTESNTVNSIDNGNGVLLCSESTRSEPSSKTYSIKYRRKGEAPQSDYMFSKEATVEENLHPAMLDTQNGNEPEEKLKKRGRGRPRKNPNGDEELILPNSSTKSFSSCKKSSERLMQSGQRRIAEDNEADGKIGQGLPRKRFRRSKPINRDEWATESDLEAATASKSAFRERCRVCCRMFKSKMSLNNHMRDHSQSFTLDEWATKRDVKSVAGEDVTQHICSICGRSFKSKLSLYSHRKVHSQKSCKQEELIAKLEPKSVVAGNGVSEHSCSVCGRMFKSKWSVNAHSKVHFQKSRNQDECATKQEGKSTDAGQDASECRCSVCDRAFKNSISLGNHMRTHSKSRNQDECATKLEGKSTDAGQDASECRCSVCDRAFKNSISLGNHMRTHSSEPKSKKTLSPRKHGKEIVKLSSHDETRNSGVSKKNGDDHRAHIMPGDSSRIHNDKKPDLEAVIGNSPEKSGEISKSEPVKSSKDSHLRWTCEVCTFTCTSYDNLQQHISDFHGIPEEVDDAGIPEEVDDAPASPQEEPFRSNTNELEQDKSSSFECPECGEIFSNLESFSAHAEQQGHGNLQGSCWICGVCEAAFFEEKDLNEHLVSHNPVEEDIPSLDDRELPVTILDQEISPSVNGFMTSSDILDKASKNTFISHDKVEADSSVLDSENTIQIEQVSNKCIERNDSEINTVTSSVNNEKIGGNSVYSQIQREFEEMFADLD